MERMRSIALDSILGKAFPVLDDGFVRVVDYMGNDEAVVQAARISYGTGTKRLREDRGLIRYLMRHSHTTPFEMCEVKLHVRAPMDVWRQWIRHRTASVNEYSTRYSIAIDAAQKTAPDSWRRQSWTTNKEVRAPYQGNLDLRCLMPKPSFTLLLERSIRSDSLLVWPGSKPGRTCHSRRTQKHTGRSISTTFFISCVSAWHRTPKLRSARTPTR